jgi:hypothetical protein
MLALIKFPLDLVEQRLLLLCCADVLIATKSKLIDDISLRLTLFAFRKSQQQKHKRKCKNECVPRYLQTYYREWMMKQEVSLYVIFIHIPYVCS